MSTEHWMPDERRDHESILRFGWSDFKGRQYLSVAAYREFMGKLNPFAKAYFTLFERYESVKHQHEKLQAERNHYYERYMELARAAQVSIRAYNEQGITEKAVRAAP